MEFLRKISIFLISFFILLNSHCVGIFGDEDEYYIGEVSNGSINKIESYWDYYSANISYLNNVDNYDNLLLLHNDEVIKMEYGVVEFKTNGEGTLNISYTSLNKNSESSINGSFGIDGAYLYSNYDGSGVYFKIAGDIGYTAFDDVVLYPYGLSNNRISVYQNIDGKFCHLIKTQFDLDYYSTVLSIDDKLDYLQDNKNYFSYDGHYFYEDFYTMIDDYTNETYFNALNADNPYYNYYQYLPYRSLTNHNYEEVEKYFEDILKIDGQIYSYEDIDGDDANDKVNKSQYYKELDNFFAYQNIYGANAMMMLSVSSNETNMGKSLNTFNSNNLFSDFAYESELEKNNKRYNNLANSIYSYAKYYVSNKYSNYRNTMYYGSFLGNKLSGINSSYKNDPYWGEKASSLYYKFDSALSYKDKNNYCIGIINNTSDTIIYKDESLKNKMMRLGNISSYSLIILEENASTYKVQVDPSMHSEYKYDFDRSVGYVSKDAIDIILNKERIHSNELVEVKINTNQGKVCGDDILTYKYLKGTSLVIPKPDKQGYEFNSYKMNSKNDDESLTYSAKYKTINSIEIKNPISNTVYIDNGLDLSDSSIEVYYVGALSKEVEITTDMISNYNPYLLGEQNITINYCGVSIEQKINVKENEEVIKAKDLISKNISSYLTDETYEDNEIKKIKTYLTNNHNLSSFEEIRLIDSMLLNKYRDNVNYRIDENNYDLSVSGLTLSLAEASVTSWFKPFTDTYYVKLANVSSSDKKALTEISEAYGFKPIDFINISYSLNMKKEEQTGSTVISLDIKNKQDNKIYSVYRIDDNGDIVKCKTIQTKNKIEFITSKSGSFAILEKDSVNQYDIEDSYENITINNSDPDNHKLFIIGDLLMLVIVLGFVVMVIYYRIENKRMKLWKDYKKSLLKAESAQEEKQKN